MKTNYLKFAIGLLLAVTVVFTSCKDDEVKSNLAGLTAFGFASHANISGLENVIFTVDQINNTITNENELPYMTDVSALTPEFEAIAKTTVMVDGTELVSGQSVIDFSSPKQIVVTAEDGITTVTYTVTVNVSQINPEGVSWVKEQSAVTANPYQTVVSVYFKDKYRTIYGSVSDGVASSVYYTSTDGVAWTQETIDEDNFPMGSRHDLIVHNDKLYVLAHFTITFPYGPTYALPGVSNDIWESTDGITFTKLANGYAVPWGGKLNTAMYSTAGKLWVVGGNTTGFGNPDGTKAIDADFYGPAGLSDQIHNTMDLSAWEEGETDLLPEGAPRRYSANVVHNDKMFMIGGQLKGGYLSSDVWSSADGKTWTLVSTGAITARMKAGVISYDNKLWLIGGQTGLGECSAEILISEDEGLTWMAPEEDALLPEEFTPRAGHAVYLDANDKVWIVGGYSAEKTSETDPETQEITYSEELTSLSDVWSGKLNKLTE
ncbi:hypothetical protein SAMN06265379_10931 [Saccharicrinis carchari]|uniref:Cadherin-like beta sandwich domain-containing protein n=1 Tax=Saccharicrinis carchari TaxID=1168039 RepID=A0A521EI15_SACCC|nr:DUF6242 domain-containing protein [Saccharicrinis carchari]SMO83492.1 hypothetical protein SAMN06265379_10931 [Saccharicrinis carchari]